MPALVKHSPYPFLEVSSTQMCVPPGAPPIVLAIETLHHELCQIIRNMPVVRSPLPQDLEGCGLSIDSVRYALESSRRILGQLNRERSGSCFCIDPGEMMCILWISTEASRWLIEIKQRADSRTMWIFNGFESTWQAWQAETQTFQALIRGTCTTFSNNMNAARYSSSPGDAEALHTLWLNREDRARFQLLQGGSPQGEYDRIVGQLNSELQNERIARSAGPRARVEGSELSLNRHSSASDDSDMDLTRVPLLVSPQREANSDTRASQWLLSK